MVLPASISTRPPGGSGVPFGRVPTPGPVTVMLADGASTHDPDWKSTTGAAMSMRGAVKLASDAASEGMVSPFSSGRIVVRLAPPNTTWSVASSPFATIVIEPGRVMLVVASTMPSCATASPFSVTLPRRETSSPLVSLSTSAPPLTAGGAYSSVPEMPDPALTTKLVCVELAAGSAICTLEPAARIISPAGLLMAPAFVTWGPSSATKPPLSKPLTPEEMLAPASTRTPILPCPGTSPAENSAELPVNVVMPGSWTPILTNRPFDKNVVLALASSDGARISVPFGARWVTPFASTGT